MADSRGGSDGVDVAVAPMAEEPRADCSAPLVSAAAAKPAEGEEPSNWANLPDGILQEVSTYITDKSSHVLQIPVGHDKGKRGKDRLVRRMHVS